MNKRSSERAGKIFSPDQPIRKSGEDQLGRKGFAEHMAKAIKGWKGNDSLCLALYGEWGSGKTSIKNMIVDSLSKSKKKQTLIVEFNPWQWSGQEQLISAFFMEVGSALGKSDTSQEGKKRASLFKLYGAAFTIGSAAVKGLRLMAPIVGIPGADLILEPTQRGFDALKEGAEGGEKASAEDITLEEKKGEIAKSLRSLNKSIIVIIDDIDRLLDEEIRLLFRLVKVNADFPNVIYLMLFHRVHVENALPGGRSYMEKIVQVGFEVPKVDARKLKELVDKELRNAVKGTSMLELYESQYSRWDAIYRGGASHFLRTMRDIKRFTSNFAFCLGMFRKGETPEINPVDLAAIQIIALSEPGVFHRIHASKQALTADYQRTSVDKSRSEKCKEILQHIMGPSLEENRIPLGNIVKQLFPALNVSELGVIHAVETQASILRNVRICDPNFFDRYFYLDVQNDDISQGELLSLFRNANNHQHLLKSLLELIKRGYWEVLFDRMQVHTDYLEGSNIETFIAALCDVGEKIVSMELENQFFMTEERLAKLVGSLLIERQCEEAILAAFGKSEGILVPLHFALSTLSGATDPSFAMRALKLSIQKISAAAKSGRLYDHPRIGFLLRNWHWHSSEPEDAKEWFRSTITSQDGIIHILNAFNSDVLTSDKGWIKRTDLKSIREFISLKDLRVRLAKINASQCSTESLKIINAWGKASQDDSDEDVEE